LNDYKAFGVVRLPDCSRRVVRQEKLGNGRPEWTLRARGIRFRPLIG